MRNVTRITVTGDAPRSLVWLDDDIYDPAGGWVQFTLNGTYEHGPISYPYLFDRAILSPTRSHAAIYTALGTKGLLLKGTEILRELNRSYYFAHIYEYPIAFMLLPDGSEALIHCPDDYNRLDIERVDGAERLTRRSGKGVDIFPSRLQVSPGSRYLLSAGWYWHPWDILRVFDLQEALNSPEILDGEGLLPCGAIAGEVQSAAFLDDESILVVTGSEEPPNEAWQEEGGLGPCEMGVWSIPERQWISHVPIKEDVGTLMPASDHIVGFFEHPKLIEIATGNVIARWSDIQSGRQASSIIHHVVVLPIAMDLEHRRFAVGSNATISVVYLEDSQRTKVL